MSSHGSAHGKPSESAQFRRVHCACVHLLPRLPRHRVLLVQRFGLPSLHVQGAPPQGTDSLWQSTMKNLLECSAGGVRFDKRAEEKNGSRATRASSREVHT